MAHDLVFLWLSPRPVSQSYVVINKPSGALGREEKKARAMRATGVFVLYIRLSLAFVHVPALWGEEKESSQRQPEHVVFRTFFSLQCASGFVVFAGVHRLLRQLVRTAKVPSFVHSNLPPPT